MLSSTFDFIVYLTLCFPLGYVVGFLTVKINHVLIIFLGKLWTSGNAQQRYVVVGGFATLVFASVLKLLLLIDFELMSLMTFVFAVMFAVGIKHAMKRFGQYIEILKALIQSLFPKDQSSDDQHDKLLEDTLKISEQMIKAMQKSQVESLKILFFFFDSIFAVFFFSLIKRKFRFSRFINLSKQDQVDYMNTWASTYGLNLAPVALKALIGYSYYTSQYSWKKIGYHGEVLRRSYID